jgi:cytidylate kinase
MIITISGDIGSGKSTTGKLLAKKMGYGYLSTGAIQRQIAEEMGLTTLELNLLTESRKDIDDKIDSYTKALNDSSENYIVDSRLAWHFIPNSFKVFLLCEDEIAAQRISKDNDRKSDDQDLPVIELLAKIKERRKSEKRRFKKIYDIDFEDLSNYDLVVDSAYFYPEQTADMIIEGLILQDQDMALKL